MTKKQGYQQEIHKNYFLFVHRLAQQSKLLPEYIPIHINPSGAGCKNQIKMESDVWLNTRREIK